MRDRRLLLETPPDATALGRAGRTALLFPVYHEAPAAIAACIQAIGEDLRRLGAADKFDVFILSDTRGDAAGDAEAAAYDALRAATDAQPTVYYRRRAQNTAKKAGNIKDWLSRFGGGYTTFVILDADSVMSGETLLRLAAGHGRATAHRADPDRAAAGRRTDAVPEGAAVRGRHLRTGGLGRPRRAGTGTRATTGVTTPSSAPPRSPTRRACRSCPASCRSAATS